MVAGITLLTALIATRAADVPIRDPKHVTTTRLATTVVIVVVMGLICAAVAHVRARRGTRDIRRTGNASLRAAEAAAALVSFYVAYLAYRNLKSVVPLLRPDALFDRPLLRIDRVLAGGGDPGQALHSLLGVGAAAHVLSAVYMLFFSFIPLTLSALLVAHWRGHRGALFLVTALSINWALAAATYFALPAIGPFHARPQTFATLPDTPVARLEATLLRERSAFLANPSAPGAAQSIGAFASLHVSIYVTAAIGAHLLGLNRAVRATAWILVALTAVSTIYFGWHYLADDVAGVLIAVLALVIARFLTGWSPRQRSALEPAERSV